MPGCPGGRGHTGIGKEGMSHIGLQASAALRPTPYSASFCGGGWPGLLTSCRAFGCWLLQVIYGLSWPGSTSLQDMRIASGGGPLGQLSLALPAIPLTILSFRKKFCEQPSIQSICG